MTSHTLIDLIQRAPALRHAASFADLTVALFSYQRRTLMHRQLALWARTDATLLVLDGSDKPDAEAAEVAGGSPHITYVHERSFARRFGHLAEHLRTPFGMILADDDTALRSGTQACLDLLRRSPQVGTCIGQGMFALADRPPGSFTLISARGTWLGGRIGYTREEPDPAERMARIAYPFVTKVYYGVQRSEVLRPVARVCSRLPAHWPPSAGVFEQVVEELSVGLAPLRSTPAVHTIRWDDPARNPSQPSDAEPITATSGAPSGPDSDWESWFKSADAWQTRTLLTESCLEAGVPVDVANAFIHTLFNVFPPYVVDPTCGIDIRLAAGEEGQNGWTGPLARARALVGRHCSSLLHATGLGTQLALADLARSGGWIDMAELRATGRFRLHGI